MRPLTAIPRLISIWVSVLLAGSTQSQTIQWDIERQQSQSKLERRADSTYEEVITNEKGVGGYFATARLGTPGQNVTLQLDTASSDVWVPWAGATSCRSKKLSGESGCYLGSFKPKKSKTYYDFMPNAFDISYVDDSYAKGDYIVDSFEISGAKIENLTMGLARQTDLHYGLLGVGYAINEASVTTAGYQYQNLPILMQEQGLIESIAFSLWLNDLDASTGNILFGGVDTQKYVGDMHRLSVLKDEDANNYTHFAVHLETLEAFSPSGSDTLSSEKWPLEVILDSGTTLTYLPRKTAELVWEEVGAHYNPQIEMAVLPCSYADHPGYFSFGFGGTNGLRINITMDELVVDLTNGRAPEFHSGDFKGERVCQFGIQAGYAEPYTLGDTFLRSAYVVYDLENNEIGLAMTDFNSTETDVVPFESKGAKIPSATMGSNSASTPAPRKPQSTELTAADGFQNGKNKNKTEDGGGDDDSEDGAPSLHALSETTFLVTGLLLLYTALGSL